MNVAGATGETNSAKEEQKKTKVFCDNRQRQRQRQGQGQRQRQRKRQRQQGRPMTPKRNKSISQPAAEYNNKI